MSEPTDDEQLKEIRKKYEREGVLREYEIEALFSYIEKLQQEQGESHNKLQSIYDLARGIEQQLINMQKEQDKFTAKWAVIYDDGHWPWYKRLWRRIRKRDRLIAYVDFKEKKNETS